MRPVFEVLTYQNKDICDFEKAYAIEWPDIARHGQVTPASHMGRAFQKFLKHEKLVKEFIKKNEVEKVEIGGKSLIITPGSFKLNEFDFACLYSLCKVCNKECHLRLGD